MVIEKLIEAMRQAGLYNALVDEDDTHYLIATTVEQMESPVRVNKAFVQCARLVNIVSVLREKFGLPEVKPDGSP